MCFSVNSLYTGTLYCTIPSHPHKIAHSRDGCRPPWSHAWLVPWTFLTHIPNSVLIKSTSLSRLPGWCQQSDRPTDRPMVVWGAQCEVCSVRCVVWGVQCGVCNVRCAQTRSVSPVSECAGELWDDWTWCEADRRLDTQNAWYRRVSVDEPVYTQDSAAAANTNYARTVHATIKLNWTEVNINCTVRRAVAPDNLLVECILHPTWHKIPSQSHH